jgi:hypothetical protein
VGPGEVRIAGFLTQLITVEELEIVARVGHAPTVSSAHATQS